MHYELLHVFPAVLDVYSFLRDAVQLSALKIVDGTAGRWEGDILNVCYDGSGTERALVGDLPAVYLTGHKDRTWRYTP